jgi:heme-degrading monooxygenase HmoA
MLRREGHVAYDIIWEFRVSPKQAQAFETAYGADGDWAHLFARAEGFVDVRLLKCLDQNGRYLTVDRWVSQDAYKAFRAQFADEYAALDARLEGLAVHETRVGAFAPADGD